MLLFLLISWVIKHISMHNLSIKLNMNTFSLLQLVGDGYFPMVLLLKIWWSSDHLTFQAKYVKLDYLDGIHPIFVQFLLNILVGAKVNTIIWNWSPLCKLMFKANKGNWYIFITFCNISHAGSVFFLQILPQIPNKNLQFPLYQVLLYEIVISRGWKDGFNYYTYFPTVQTTNKIKYSRVLEMI